MGIVELKNDKIAIKVNTHGAELVSLKSIETDREYIRCGFRICSVENDWKSFL